MDQKQSSTELAIKRVTLYTSGVGYFERCGDVDGDDRRTLYFPVDQINDVLKSLTLLDHGKGSVKPVTYAAQDPMDKALQAFSVDVSDNPSRATLLNRIRGAEVELEIADGVGKKVEGVVVGVEKATVALPEKMGTTAVQHVNVLTDNGIRTIDLATVDTVRIKDQKLAAEIRQALATVAKGRDASKRPLTLTFSGDGSRRVDVAYLVEAPVWQTTYRLVIGDKPRLQGWALVQNTGQDDWTETELTLVSGQPISFRQDLYTPLYLTRPMVQPRIDKLQMPLSYGAELGGVASCAPAASKGMRIGEAATGRVMYDRASEIDAAPQEKVRGLTLGAGIDTAIETTGAELGTALFAYRIDVPVSVPRQESAMIPFVSSEIEAETVSVYRESTRAKNPLLGARMRNTTGLHLMGGPLTIFASTPAGDTGYTGDALMDDTEPDQRRLITYAVDLAVDAAVDRPSSSDFVQAVKIAKGSVEAKFRTEYMSVYRFKNHDSKDRLIVVEHPMFGSDYTLVQPASSDEKTADHYRFDIPVTAGQSAEFKVRLDRSHTSRWSLSSMSTGAMVNYSRYGVCPESVGNALKEVARKRDELDAIDIEVKNLEKQEKAIADGQERIRKNMAAVDQKSDLYRRYVKDLTEQEDKILSLQQQTTQKRTELARLQQEFADHVAGLNLE